MSEPINVGIVGLGANTRLRHLPGLAAVDDVRIVSVANRRPKSTVAAAEEFGIPKKFADWRDLVNDDDINAVVIGTWPYLHCEVTLAALEAGKHVLCEARMARNLHEARQMYRASQEYSTLVAQIVPSPFGLRVHRTVLRLIDEGVLGELREIVVRASNSLFADPETPRHWRQNAYYSGLNALSLGILHETLVRWTPDPLQVFSLAHRFTSKRLDEETGRLENVGTPDCIQVLATLPAGACATYHISSGVYHGPGPQIELYGSEGTLKCEFGADERLYFAGRDESAFREVEIPTHEAGGWRVEEEFVSAVRGDQRVQFTNFEAGLRNMAFTQAVGDSASHGQPFELEKVP